MPSEIEFHAAPHQDIGCGEHESVASDIVILGWNCTACGKLVEYDPAIVFAQAVEPAMFHHRTCLLIPREC